MRGRSHLRLLHSDSQRKGLDLPKTKKIEAEKSDKEAIPDYRTYMRIEDIL